MFNISECNQKKAIITDFYQLIYQRKLYDSANDILAKNYSGFFLKYPQIKGINDFIDSVKIFHSNYSNISIDIEKFYFNNENEVCIIANMNRTRKTSVNPHFSEGIPEKLKLVDIYTFDEKIKITSRRHYKIND
ncbi:hypothetical protein Ppb6_03838 [Photorhabdus australis subsp. thailandensis]|uniref:SnoaL-like domain-containing protein n=2 Tax=Photorhabdus australis TaxID=286156 RepID=A0A1C0TYJ3_9GAMM|nr:hypothetical protein [Photorhabdus australis]OCQ50742.1 hypothetical protein Ppb6_03838 [Photorhabdus australis subsp. thailandensis]